MTVVFSSCGRLDIGCYIHYFVWIEVETYNGIVALRLCGFLFYAEAVALLVELSHTIAFRIVDPVAEDRSLLLLVGSSYGFLEHLGESRSMEDIVAKHEASAVVADEVLADSEGLSKSIG